MFSEKVVEFLEEMMRIFEKNTPVFENLLYIRHNVKNVKSSVEVLNHMKCFFSIEPFDKETLSSQALQYIKEYPIVEIVWNNCSEANKVIICHWLRFLKNMAFNTF